MSCGSTVTSAGECAASCRHRFYVTQAATGTTEITASIITTVADATQTAAAGITQSQAASHDLAPMAGTLQTPVGQFRY